MKKIAAAFIFLSVLASFSFAQHFKSEAQRAEVENILNTVLNSAQFSSGYGKKKVYFLANELLTEDSSLMLERKGKKAVIADIKKIKKKTYAVLGDFTTNWDNMVTVRVQIEVMPKRTLLNFFLAKEDGVWVIKNYAVIDEWACGVQYLKEA